MKKWKNFLLSLGLGQVLSLLVTFAGFTLSQLAKKGIGAPLAQCWLSYVLLALVYAGTMIYRREPFKEKMYYYIMLTWIDVWAKIFVICAYGFTSLTSIFLLECWTIPCVLFLSWLFLKTKYGCRKLVGVAICVAGLVTVGLSDLHSVDRLTSIMALKGDLIIIVGATIYGVSKVFERNFIKKADRVEIMAGLGIYGSILFPPLIATCELNQLKLIISSPETIFLVIGFSIAMFLFYSGVSLLLKINESKWLNVSLLTSSLWAVLIRIFAYHEKVNWIYFVAFAFVTLGLIVYSGGDEMDPNMSNAAAIDEETDLGHNSDKIIPISNNDGSRTLKLVVSIKIQGDDVRE